MKIRLTPFEPVSRIKHGKYKRQVISLAFDSLLTVAFQVSS